MAAEVLRLLLEAYYDVQFPDYSHGFRPHRGCHTALDEVVRVWNGTRRNDAKALQEESGPASRSIALLPNDG